MSRIVVLVLCVQAYLIQAALSQQCGCNRISSGPSGLGYSSPCQPSVSLSPPGCSSSYGGTGTGQVGVSGDIGASGQTCVIGSVPVLGSVDFSGCVPACGTVSICGQCGCGCN